MAFNAEQKKVWRREHRARLDEYQRGWREQKLAADPTYFDRQKEAARVKAEAAKPVVMCACGRSFKKRGRATFCGPSCRPGVAKRTRPVDLWNGVAHRAAERLNNRARLHSLSPLDQMAAKCARVLRLMGRNLSRRERQPVPSRRSWDRAFAACSQQAANARSRLKISRLDLKFASIAASINTRRKTHGRESNTADQGN